MKAKVEEINRTNDARYAEQIRQGPPPAPEPEPRKVGLRATVARVVRAVGLR